MTIETVREISRDDCASLNAHLARLLAQFNSPQNMETMARNLRDVVQTCAAIWVAGLVYQQAATVQTVDEVAQVMMSTVTDVTMAPDESLGTTMAPILKSMLVYELLSRAMSMSNFLAAVHDAPQAAAPAVA